MDSTWRKKGDIVERLRSYDYDDYAKVEELNEAADEIERLRGELIEATAAARWLYVEACVVYLPEAERKWPWLVTEPTGPQAKEQ